MIFKKNFTVTGMIIVPTIEMKLDINKQKGFNISMFKNKISIYINIPNDILKQ
ncbi:hypothetical protein RBU49_00990 [Clostridium sp. MB40-C1]|uniref:hypothetical protein n=1 Tax=Clostridium sp. MB40-C1 TaxID=3070996 RepID=UPI0027E0671A|nr:hypothetical protein [Clostridium sp. MB40-C1]WMJ80854.1 hypothetical protein RBU49_00990 [Clostridium sp. MB40-C1]